MTDETKPSLSRLIKLISMTRSAHDGEALNALRLANREALKFGDWEKILSTHITVVGDPFAAIPTPDVARTRPQKTAAYTRPTPPHTRSYTQPAAKPTRKSTRKSTLDDILNTL